MSNYTQAETIALAQSASIKSINGKKWEKQVEKTLQENNFLPGGKLTGSIFKTNTYDCYNDNKVYKKKIIDQWLPKFNHILECKNSIGDGQIAEFMIATDSFKQLNNTKFGDDFKFIVLINEKPTDRNENKLKILSDNHDTFHYYIGERGLREYIKTLTNPISQESLPIGKFEMTDLSILFDNDVNRPLNMPQVYDLVESLITPMRNGKGIRGLVRPFIGIERDGKKQLIDAHHLKKACTIVNEFTPYTITEVPVYYLTHLDDVTEEELTMLMSVINVLVKKWDVFDYVELWEKTFDKLGEPDAKYPYTKLKESMITLNPDKPNSAPILQAFCLDAREQESNWSSNTRKVHFGKLSFDKDKFEKKFEPIVQSILKLKERIEKTKKVVGSKYVDSNMGPMKTPTPLAAVLRAYATEMSLQEYEEGVDEEVYYESLKDLANGYWNDDEVLPVWENVGSYKKRDFHQLSKFARSADEMKNITKEIIFPSLERTNRKKLQSK